MNNFLSILIACILLFCSSQLWAETDCSREAVGFYLEKGFTPEQISRMCQAPPASVPEPANKQSVTPGDSDKAVSDNDEEMFFTKSILADSVSITPQTLIFTRDQCIKYGRPMPISEIREKVCGNIQTTINRVGLKVLKAIKRISIFRDAEFLVEGEIHREVLNLDTLDSDDQKVFAKILDPYPAKFNIETRDDADPVEMAVRLPK